jgi:hypothetical protein
MDLLVRTLVIASMLAVVVLLIIAATINVNKAPKESRHKKVFSGMPKQRKVKSAL